MRRLVLNEIQSVSGGNAQSFLQNSYDSALHYGATGALIHMVLRGATLAGFGYGLVCGAAIGVLYAATVEILPNPF